jgi:hypothetical protein
VSTFVPKSAVLVPKASGLLEAVALVPKAVALVPKAVVLVSKAVALLETVVLVPKAVVLALMPQDVIGHPALSFVAEHPNIVVRIDFISLTTEEMSPNIVSLFFSATVILFLK